MDKPIIEQLSNYFIDRDSYVNQPLWIDRTNAIDNSYSTTGVLN